METDSTIRKRKQEISIVGFEQNNNKLVFHIQDSFIAPHQYLINEFRQETGQDIYILSVHDFLDKLLSRKEKENAEIQQLLAQLREKPTLGHNQQIAPLMAIQNSI